MLHEMVPKSGSVCLTPLLLAFLARRWPARCRSSRVTRSPRLITLGAGALAGVAASRTRAAVACAAAGVHRAALALDRAPRQDRRSGVLGAGDREVRC
jgi:hypothetical protein